MFWSPLFPFSNANVLRKMAFCLSKGNYFSPSLFYGKCSALKFRKSRDINPPENAPFLGGPIALKTEPSRFYNGGIQRIHYYIQSLADVLAQA